MPVWSSRNSSNNKEEQRNSYSNRRSSSVNSSIKNDRKKIYKDRQHQSFDEVSKRTSKDVTFGFEKMGHPLPRPSLGFDQRIGLESGSGSASSVSSSGSADDNAQFNVHSRQEEVKFIMMPRSPELGSRVGTSPTSPFHPRLTATNVEFPMVRQEDGKSQCHRLPLPPGSPTSPIPLANSRASGATENTHRTLSNWKKGRLLGRGTFGHVYLGFNSENGQMCAIKEVKVVSDDSTSKESLKQLNQEINLLSQLSHPNIVQYYGSELGEETLSVYLEYVSGGSIHKLLQEYGLFKEPIIQNYTRQIVSGLAYLHGRNTMHRDIKGANILVDPNGEIKLADFGMAKHITSRCSMLSFKGSPYWMAPEVVMNTNGYGLAVDIWSLGCTILEMATSKPPWSQFEGVAAIFKIGNSKDCPEIPDHLSNDAKSFLKLYLQRDPSARPTSSQLLEHPFIRNQANTKVENINIIKDAFSHAFDGGSHTLTASDLRSNKRVTSCDGDLTTKQAAPCSRALPTPIERIRTFMPLPLPPVPPCSTPSRQYGPTYTTVNDNSEYPTKPTTTYTLDHELGNSLLNPQTQCISKKTHLSEYICIYYQVLSKCSIGYIAYSLKLIEIMELLRMVASGRQSGLF